MATIFRTEAEVFRAIDGLYRKRGGYAVLPGVADATGGRKSREIDCLVVGMWPSRGLTLHGIEIKTRRGDWLRELANPQKQETIFCYCDHFSLAVGDPDIVKKGELPATWGLMVPARKYMKVAVKPPELTPSKPLSREFLAAILRRVDEQAMRARTQIRNELLEEMDDVIQERVEIANHRLLREVKDLTAKLEVFERFQKEVGMRLDHRWGDEDRTTVAKLIRALSKHGSIQTLTRVCRAAEHLKRVSSNMLERAVADAQELEQATQALLESDDKDAYDT